MQEYLKTRGRVFDIQRYSIHDGYGIRTIVFLKGCFLRCRWCCNPESQNAEIESMLIDHKTKSIGWDCDVASVIEIVKKDRAYYQRTNGGMTLSGGEVLFQPDFSRDLLRAAFEEGIHTAVESTAYSNWNAIEGLLPYLNQYLLDIKHIDSKKHKEYTGVPNEKILENAKRIANYKGVELSIRIPLIPGFNNNFEVIKEISQFAKELGNVKRIHLLAYHRLGIDKYKGLNRDYLLKELLPPKLEQIQELRNVAHQYSQLECQIGG